MWRLEGPVIRTVKYADDVVLLAEGETVLQEMIDRLIDIGRCCGTGMNVVEKKTEVLRFSRQPFAIRIMIDQKQLENVEYLNCSGSLITSDARCTYEIKSKIAVTKAVLNKKVLFISSWP